MKTLELKSWSVAELLGLIEQQPAGFRHLFRGQCDASWGLVPALYRIEQTGIGAKTLEESYDFFEAGAVKRFFDEGLPYLPPVIRSYSNDRILAQHFGVPTRFLDWSKDPLVAAYFAVERWDSDADVAIYMIMPDAHTCRSRLPVSAHTRL